MDAVTVREKQMMRISACATLSLLAGCTAMAPPSAAIPDALKVPDTQKLKYVVKGTGMQIYVCRRSKEAATEYAWDFTAPEAQLTDLAGQPFGHHFAGPTWEALDGSRVAGQVKSRDVGPDGTAIPWLLLTATSSSDTGKLAAIKSIQRLKTVGGQAPASGCTADSADQTLRVPYQAEYRFYVSKP